MGARGAQPPITGARRPRAHRPLSEPGRGGTTAAGSAASATRPSSEARWPLLRRGAALVLAAAAHADSTPSQMPSDFQ